MTNHRSKEAGPAAKSSTGSSILLENAQYGRDFRGAFACVGSDDHIHSVEARFGPLGEIRLTLDDGRRLLKCSRGVYMTEDGTLRLTCDHPDAP